VKFFILFLMTFATLNLMAESSKSTATMKSKKNIKRSVASVSDTVEDFEYAFLGTNDGQWRDEHLEAETKIINSLKHNSENKEFKCDVSYKGESSGRTLHGYDFLYNNCENADASSLLSHLQSSATEYGKCNIRINRQERAVKLTLKEPESNPPYEIYYLDEAMAYIVRIELVDCGGGFDAKNNSAPKKCTVWSKCTPK
jgi:hypothetical protein